ncbi:MAG: hypothetical protein J7L57_01070 [Deltaproteobacteria bacterium]|nr:hypothetical protein [Candidatus Tharpella sp.]
MPTRPLGTTATNTTATADTLGKYATGTVPSVVTSLSLPILTFLPLPLLPADPPTTIYISSKPFRGVTSRMGSSQEGTRGMPWAASPPILPPPPTLWANIPWASAPLVVMALRLVIVTHPYHR